MYSNTVCGKSWWLRVYRIFKLVETRWPLAGYPRGMFFASGTGLHVLDISVAPNVETKAGIRTNLNELLVVSHSAPSRSRSSTV